MASKFTERTLVGMLLVDGTLCEYVKKMGITWRDFSYPKLHLIMRRCIELYEKDIPVEYVTIAMRLDTKQVESSYPAKTELEFIGGKEELIKLIEETESTKDFFLVVANFLRSSK